MAKATTRCGSDLCDEGGTRARAHAARGDGNVRWYAVAWAGGGRLRRAFRSAGDGHRSARTDGGSRLARPTRMGRRFGGHLGLGIAVRRSRYSDRVALRRPGRAASGTAALQSAVTSPAPTGRMLPQPHARSWRLRIGPCNTGWAPRQGPARHCRTVGTRRAPGPGGLHNARVRVGGAQQ